MQRSKSGATMGLVAASAYVLALMVLASAIWTILIGGNQELRNATDSGALNLGKQIFNSDNFKVTKEASQFQELADKNGKFGLANINAVWGKALLAEANAQSMQEEGLAGTAKQNADKLFDEARSISDELSGKLKNREKQAAIFESLAQQNTPRMLGNQARLSATNGADAQAQWQSSYMNRGKAANLEVPAADLISSERVLSALHIQNNRISGYEPLIVGGRTFCFVPFVENERTHLVSKSAFDDDTLENNPIEGAEWRNPMPNAFSCSATCNDQLGLQHQAVSCVLANPQKLYRIGLPHGFIHIRLEQNRAEWLFNAPDPRINGFDIALREKHSNYENRLDLQRKSGGGLSAIDGELTASLVPLGQEYTANPTLESALFGSDREDGSRARLERALVQRANQILTKPGTTLHKEDLHRVLRDSDAAVAMLSGKQDFYLFSTDGAELILCSKEQAVQKAPWLADIIDAEADGSTSAEYAKLSSFQILLPGIVRIDPFPRADIVVPAFGKLNVEIENSWKPGSGYGGCLGELTCRHKSKVYLWGIAILPVAPGGGGLLDRVGEFFGI